MALLRCPECGMSFLTKYDIELFSKTQVDNLRTNSSVSLHVSRTGHFKILIQQPLIIKVDPSDQISAGEKMAIMQAIYITLGYKCKTDKELVILPKLLIPPI